MPLHCEQSDMSPHHLKLSYFFADVTTTSWHMQQLLLRRCNNNEYDLKIKTSTFLDPRTLSTSTLFDLTTTSLSNCLSQPHRCSSTCTRSSRSVKPTSTSQIASLQYRTKLLGLPTNLNSASASSRTRTSILKARSSGFRANISMLSSRNPPLKYMKILSTLRRS